MAKKKVVKQEKPVVNKQKKKVRGVAESKKSVVNVKDDIVSEKVSYVTAKERVAEKLEQPKVEKKYEGSLNEFELKLYNKVLALMQTAPSAFSIRTNNGFAIGDVAVNISNTIAIKLDGTFVKPYELPLNDEEKDVLKKHINIIARLDKDETVKLIINKI